MKIIFYTTILEIILMIFLSALEPKKSENNKTKPNIIKIDTIPTGNVIDTIAVLDSIYSTELKKFIKNNKKILEAVNTIKQNNKNLETPIKKSTEIKIYKDTIDTQNDRFNTAEDYTVIREDTTNKILILPVIKKKTFWQKVKSFFKSKKKS